MSKSNLQLRMLTAMLALPVVFALLRYAPRWCVGVVLIAVAVATAYEIARLVLPPAKALVTGVEERPVPDWRPELAAPTLFLTAILPLSAILLTDEVCLSSVILCSFGAMVAPIVRRSAGQNDIANVARRMIAAFFVVTYGGLPWIAVWRLYATGHGGADRLYLAFAIVWASDTAGFAVGRTLGKRPLAPTISPKKTVEGAIASFVAGIAAAVGCGVILPTLDLSAAPLAGLGALAGGAGQFGDLFKSVLKRRVAVKDSGDLIPGHGGLLDRLDSLLLAAPVLWLAFVLRTCCR